MRGNILIDIPGELRSSAIDNIVVSADGVHDYTKNKSQELINEEQRQKNEYIQDSMYRLDQSVNNTASQLQDRMHDLELDLNGKMNNVEQDLTNKMDNISSNIDDILSKADEAYTNSNEAKTRANNAYSYTDEREDAIRTDVDHQLDDIRLETDSTFIASASYNASARKIEFTNANGDTVVDIDASSFIKDGMISSASVSNGYLVITFNTDAGKDAIRIPVTDIFNADNYYTKIQTDSLMETTRQIVENAAATIDDYAQQIDDIRKTADDGNRFLNNKIDAETSRAIAAEKSIADSFTDERQNRIDAISAIDTKVNTEVTRSQEADERQNNRLTALEDAMIPATVTNLGLVKLYNQSGTNRSGLSINDDGALLINTASEYGLSRSGDGKLIANIRRSATTDDINKLGTADASSVAAVTVSNFNEIATKANLLYKESGKGLSTNDFTNSLKTKLEGIASGAEVNVQSDWSIADTNSDAYIKNKPTNLSQFAADSTHRLVTDTEKTSWNSSFKDVTYDSTNKKIKFTLINNTTKEIDASDFVKDGMVSNVEVVDSNLVITFNTDAGKNNINVPIGNMFNANNYYTKTETDSKYNPVITTTSHDESGYLIEGDPLVIGIELLQTNGKVNAINPSYGYLPYFYTDIDTDPLNGESHLIIYAGDPSSYDPNNTKVITTTKTEHEIEIYADKECTRRPTGEVNEVWVKLNRDFGFDDYYIYHATSADFPDILVITPDELNEIGYQINYAIDFWSSENSNPFKKGDVIRCYSGEPTAVTNVPKSFGNLVQVDKELNDNTSLVTANTLYERFVETPRYSDLVTDTDIDNMMSDMNLVSKITIDQTKSNSSQMITGDIGKNAGPNNRIFTNVITWIMKNTHRYVCVLDRTYSAEYGVTIAQLDDNDSSLYADGTPVGNNITDGTYEVYVKIPTFYYKGVTVNDKTTIYFAKSNIDGSYHKYDGDHTLIGAFEATYTTYGGNQILTSQCNSPIAVNKTIGELKQMARRRGSVQTNGDSYYGGYFSLITYEVHKILALLFYAYYGTTNAQAIAGNGVAYSDDWADTLYSGKSLDLGMNDTIPSNYTSYGCTNLMGFENLFGHCEELLDDLECVGDAWWELMYNGSNKRELPLGIKDTGGYIKSMVFEDACDVTPKTVGGSSSTYFTDYGDADFDDGYVASRGGNGANPHSGVGCLYLFYDPGDADDDLGSRLLYRGKIVEVDSLK